MREREVYLYVCLYQAYFRELLPIGVPQVDIFADTFATFALSSI